MRTDANKNVLDRENSAIAIARLVLDKRQTLYPSHVDELLSIAIWKFTEANGKYTTCFITRAALDSARSDIQHEHVIPRLTLRKAMMIHPNRLEQIMRLAIGCTVTKSEHRRLGNEFGWERYRAAGVEVISRQSGAIAQLEDLASKLQSAWADVLAPDRN